jgi:hypothetical protein
MLKGRLAQTAPEMIKAGTYCNDPSCRMHGENSPAMRLRRLKPLLGDGRNATMLDLCCAEGLLIGAFLRAPSPRLRYKRAGSSMRGVMG